MPFGPILVPVDFSSRSEGAARYAEALHEHFGSEIILLHVLPPPHYEFGAMEVGGPVLEELFRNRAEQAKKDIDRFMAAELPPDAAERLVVEGDPAAKIVEIAHDRGCGLIVMPTHGYGPFRRFILGSVTAKVLHDADCPVWTGVHLEAHSVEELKFKQIAAALDLGPQSERALMWAARLAEKAGAKLTIVHALPNMEGKAGEYFDPNWRVHVESSARDEIAALQKRLNLDFPVRLEAGDPAHAVCRMAAELGADVLVIGRGSASGVFGRMRANAYSIIRESGCPVVSV